VATAGLGSLPPGVRIPDQPDALGGSWVGSRKEVGSSLEKKKKKKKKKIIT